MATDTPAPGLPAALAARACALGVTVCLLEIDPAFDGALFRAEGRLWLFIKASLPPARCAVIADDLLTRYERGDAWDYYGST